MANPKMSGTAKPAAKAPTRSIPTPVKASPAKEPLMRAAVMPPGYREPSRPEMGRTPPPPPPSSGRTGIPTPVKEPPKFNQPPGVRQRPGEVSRMPGMNMGAPPPPSSGRTRIPTPVKEPPGGSYTVQLAPPGYKSSFLGGKPGMGAAPPPSGSGKPAAKPAVGSVRKTGMR